ncbi:MAG: transglutaminase family protein [Hyphomicrobiales bacterium]|nr:transglutaminase family protein [Hyphomicrobiales bacterium]
MRIKISHETSFAYDQPLRSLLQVLRVMPRDHEGQVIVSWRIDASVDGRLRSIEDAFGNRVHHFQADGPFDGYTLRVHGVVETLDMTGFVRGAAEPLPLDVYRRDTGLTQPDETMQLLARKLVRSSGNTLEQLHGLMDTIHSDMKLEDGLPEGQRRACDAFAARKGTTRDLAHIFCGCAHAMGNPARFVEGYVAGDAPAGKNALRHAWAEAWVKGYGWIGFDPSVNLCPTEAHIRVAVGLDQADTTPIRLSRVGGGGEKTSATLTVQPVEQ